MKKILVTCMALLAALPAAAQIQVQTKQVGPTPAAAAQPSPAPAPCPGMGGLEIGQTRAFSFERMAKLEPEMAKVTRDVKVVHKPAGRPWIITVVYDSGAADAKIAGLYYLVEPPSGIGDALAERYGKGTLVPGDTTVTYWDIPSCGVRLRYRSRMNERQRPLEELWVDPIPAKAAPAKTAPAKKKG
jgi:hypothetical protein